MISPQAVLITAIAVSTAILSACSDADNPPGSISGSFSPVDQNAAPEGLNGSWLGACVDGSENQDGAFYQLETHLYNDASITVTTTAHADIACQTPFIPDDINDSVPTEVRQYTAIYNGVTNNNFGYARRIDTSFVQATLDGEVQEINTLFTSRFDLFLVSDSVLFFGLINDTYDGTSPDKRPVTLDQNKFLIREVSQNALENELTEM